MDAQKIKAEVAREYPIEEQLALFMEKCVWACPDPADLPERLRMGRFMADKAMGILVQEMDVRGPRDALKAMAEVERTLNDINELLLVLGD